MAHMIARQSKQVNIHHDIDCVYTLIKDIHDDFNTAKSEKYNMLYISAQDTAYCAIWF